MTAVNGPWNEQINVHNDYEYGPLIMCEFGGLIRRFDEVDGWRQPKPYAMKQNICDEKYAMKHMR